jgi:ABC-type spermidine/putrescine transport system permease subunit I
MIYLYLASYFTIGFLLWWFLTEVHHTRRFRTVSFFVIFPFWVLLLVAIPAAVLFIGAKRTIKHIRRKQLTKPRDISSPAGSRPPLPAELAPERTD